LRLQRADKKYTIPFFIICGKILSGRSELWRGPTQLLLTGCLKKWIMNKI
jgi:hypothetical protein